MNSAYQQQGWQDLARQSTGFQGDDGFALIWIPCLVSGPQRKGRQPAPGAGAGLETEHAKLSHLVIGDFHGRELGLIVVLTS